MPIKIKAQENTANPGDSGWKENTFILWFGEGYGKPTYVLAYGHLDDALEAAAEWLAENEPGHFCNDLVSEAYADAIAEGKSEEDAWEEATTDVTCLDQSRYLLSWCWGIAAENPTREQMAAIFNKENN